MANILLSPVVPRLLRYSFLVCGVMVAKESLQILLTLCCIDPNNISSPHAVYKLSMIYFLLYPFI